MADDCRTQLRMARNTADPCCGKAARLGGRSDCVPSAKPLGCPVFQVGNRNVAPLRHRSRRRPRRRHCLSAWWLDVPRTLDWSEGSAVWSIRWRTRLPTSRPARTFERVQSGYEASYFIICECRESELEAGLSRFGGSACSPIFPATAISLCVGIKSLCRRDSY